MTIKIHINCLNITIKAMEMLLLLPYYSQRIVSKCHHSYPQMNKKLSLVQGWGTINHLSPFHDDINLKPVPRFVHIYHYRYSFLWKYCVRVVTIQLMSTTHRSLHLVYLFVTLIAVSKFAFTVTNVRFFWSLEQVSKGTIFNKTIIVTEELYPLYLVLHEM
jgi:hypothetical protein